MSRASQADMTGAGRRFNRGAFGKPLMFETWALTRGRPR